MKILYISPMNPEGLYGGNLSTKKIYRLLKKISEEKENIEVKYIFPGNSEEKDDTLFLKKNKLITYISRIFKYPEFMGFYKKKILKYIDDYKPNTIILGSSRLGFLAKEIKKTSKEIKIITNFENFELEFSKAFVKNRLPKFLWNYELDIVKRSEKDAILHSDSFIFLTKNDFNNIQKYYNLKIDNKLILPHLIEDPLKNIDCEINCKNKSDKIKLIFTGSMNYYPNVEGSLFLIENFEKMKDINPYIELTVAGRNPEKVLYNKINEYNLKDINIVSNPTKEQMTFLMLNSDIFISPVFQGSGMKTKVLDAISYGLPVLASEHSLIGYEKIKKDFPIVLFKDSKTDFLEKFTKIINYYNLYNKKDIFSMSRKLFLNNYTIDAFYSIFEDYIINRWG